jgi:hypothetical protein
MADYRAGDCQTAPLWAVALRAPFDFGSLFNLLPASTAATQFRENLRRHCVRLLAT